jgi:hypothetical protein
MDCGADGWCNACCSGTAEPCGGINEAFGADSICSTYGGTTPGAIGRGVADGESVLAPPNTGTDSTTENNWLAPDAAVGVATAVLAYKGREQRTEIEV